MRRNEGRLHWIAVVLLLGALVVHALWAASAKVTSDDFYWDLAAGRWIVEHGALPAGDVYSYTHAGAPWQNGEWLSHVVFFALYRQWGGAAIAAFKFSLFVAVFALVAWTGWRRSGSLVFAVAAAIFATYVCRPFFDLRSQLFLFLAVTAAMAVLEAYRSGDRVWGLALLPLITAVWVNAHYSFLFGGGLVLLYAGAEAAKSWLGLPDRPMPRERASLLGGAAVVAIAAMLLNPYHVRAFTYPFLLLTGPEERWRYDFLEWLPPALFVDEDFNPAIFGYFLVAQLAAAAAVLVFAWRRLDLTDGLLVAVTAVMALSTRRFVPLFALVSAPILARNLAVLRQRFLPRPEGTAELATRSGALAASGAAVALTALLLARGVPEAKESFAPGVFEGLVGADYFPAGAVEFLRLNPLPARLFHPYTWGGYIMFEEPERKVFIDGRAQTVYTFDFYLEDQIPERGQPGWSEVLDRWEVSVVLWPSSLAHGERYAPLLRLLSASPSWLRVYDDGHTAVFAHLERGRDWVDGFRGLALGYPEVSGAQMFVANTLINAGEYGRARGLLEEGLRRFPQTKELVQKAESKYLAAAQTQSSGPAWFGVGFFRDLRGDRDGATAAFREALDRGLAEPRAAAYARQALARPN